MDLDLKMTSNLCAVFTRVSLCTSIRISSAGSLSDFAKSRMTEAGVACGVSQNRKVLLTFVFSTSSASYLVVVGDAVDGGEVATLA